MTTVMYLYNNYSQGGSELAKRLGIKKLRHEGSKFTGGPNHTVINWGSGTLPQFSHGTRVLNTPQNVSRMANKRSAFQLFRNGHVRTPDFTDSLAQAQQWLGAGDTVVARTILNGHSGAGIVIMEPDRPETHDTRAQLYTKYVPKNDEFRVHIINGDVVLVQRKGLKEEFRGQPDVNWKIRNLANGFVFVRNNIQVPQDVVDQAKAALACSALVFGAVDVIYNQRQQRAYVLEINTAPGLVGTTIDDYANALRKVL